MQAWSVWLAAVSQGLAQRGAHAGRSVILLPYAQLMPVAARQWAQRHPDGFVPRFETSRNWAHRLAAFAPGPQDVAFDTARDLLTAQALLERAGLGAHRELLAASLVETATQLGALAAAVAPEERSAWAEQAQAAAGLTADAGALVFETAVARLAVVWAGASAYATDVLFSPAAHHGVDALFVIEGLQADPLALSLARHWGGSCERLPPPPAPGRGVLALHTATDGEDEAERAAACVLAHLAAGRSPVALAATDRALTRRVRSLLGARGIAIRDENGWKLSTTRAAAHLMGALRACAWDASTDAVLDWLKNAPAWSNAPLQPLQPLEAWLRRAGLPDWRAVEAVARGDAEDPGSAADVAPLVGTVAALRAACAAPRPLALWLLALREMLQASGQWTLLSADAAGAKVLAVLRLEEGAQAELSDLRAAGRRLSLTEFTAWVDAVLEASSHVPAHPAAEQVTILPLSQMLARPFGALVVPGCDEVRLPVSPEPPGPWTAAQRAALRLPAREELARVQRAAWQHALQTPACDLLWRAGDEGGEPLLPSPLVQALLLEGANTASADPRASRSLTPAPVARPLPVGDTLPVRQLSASAYSDLRACPYRFYALRQLGLTEAEELDAAVDKRDFGLWLHAVLRRFHEALARSPEADGPARAALADELAAEVTRERGLSDADFLPFAAIWPGVRDGYLAWLDSPEGREGTFETAEAWREAALGPWRLIGQLDRIDRLPDGGTRVIDYKTESLQKTRDRLKDPLEDTQLAFYAALVGEGAAHAAYLNLSEREGTRRFEQPDVTALRDQLLAGIQQDLGRIAAGAALPALGEGAACDWCAARGLCRRDFWADEAPPVGAAP